MDGEDGITVDDLAVALTRPSTVLGVPFVAVVICVVVSYVAFINTRNLLWLALYLPLHGICYLITLNDPRAFESLLLWMRTSLGTLIASRWYWSASSYSPLSFRERPGLWKRWWVKRRQKWEKKP